MNENHDPNEIRDLGDGYITPPPTLLAIPHENFDTDPYLAIIPYTPLAGFVEQWVMS